MNILQNKQQHNNTNQLVWVLKSKGKGNKDELFQRARIVQKCEDDDRILIRYPKGSTYRVRQRNILPVLEPASSISTSISCQMVIVTSETCDYRRQAVLHTCVGESFLEIGCDFGSCTDRVRHALTMPTVSRDDYDDDDEKIYLCNASYKEGEQLGRENDGPTSDDDNKKSVAAIGIDKSTESIRIAKERYPNTYFELGDALSPTGMAEIRQLCNDKLSSAYRGPHVVAIDINGSRELPAVLKCLELIMHPGCDDVRAGWLLPRLIIVKSRELYRYIVQHPQQP